ncbi:MAG: hypothetical protein L6R42_002686 [Xanthoria sp. 1 TBL-2021]|nr:MAG: hypothetical protein L6R42_002686 [Xanthoria sp. 1 TBL-2021]
MTLAFIGLLEYLSHKSRIDGGIAVAEGQFSPAVSFAYKYLPIITAVLYSILWSWIDLDTKRLEPYFQLSRPMGADAADSIWLHYPFDFIAYAPLKALRRRHWAVVFAGTSTMLIFWGVTPLVSSIFAQSMVVVEFNTTARPTATLMALSDQSPALNTGFMLTAYGFIWLGQTLPGFVSSQGALEPFEVDMVQGQGFENKTWTAETTLYGTSANCNAAIIQNGKLGLSYSNGKECTTDPGYSPLDSRSSSRFGCLYIGYHMNQFIDYSLHEMGCPSPANSHLFLGLWRHSSKENASFDETAFFCEPSYWTQKVNATVKVPGMDVSEIIPQGPRITLPDSQFNRTAFEYNIGTGSQAVSRRADVSETTNLIDQEAVLARIGLNGTFTNMVGFALGLSSLDLTDLNDPVILTTAFENAHKLLHALAIRQLMSHNVGDVQHRSATSVGRANVVLVVRPLAIIVETLLGVVVVLVLALTIHSRTRISQLKGDPASLTDVVAMLSKKYGRGRDDSSSETRHKQLSARHRIVHGKILVVGTTYNNQLPQNIDVESEPSTENKISNVNSEKTVSLARPTAMGLPIGLVFIATLLVTLCTMVVLKLYAEHNSGLPLPSRSTLVNQLVLNYVLIVVATFLEPFWLLLNRQLCVLQPFEELRQVKAKASRSLDLKYTSLPPQLILWRALCGRHYVLVAVCAIGLSANLLAISLSGLLEIKLSPVETNRNLSHPYEPLFSRIPLLPDDFSWKSDYEYIAKANITDRVSLPPWTSSDRFFVPFHFGIDSKLNQTERYRRITQGFGIQPLCQSIRFNDTAFVFGNENLFYTTQQTSTGNTVYCGGMRQAPYGGHNQSFAAAEVFQQLKPIDIRDPSSIAENATYTASEEDRLLCNSILVAGFVRANLAVSADLTRTDNDNAKIDTHVESINSISSLWMLCRPAILTAPYEVTVDQSGYVQSYAASGPYAEDLSPFFQNKSGPASLINTTSLMISQAEDVHPWWHNDTFADTWFAYYIKHLSNSTRFVDPTMPVPAYGDVVPYVESICVRLFAIVLSLNQGWLAEAEAGSATTVTVISSSERVFVSSPMFVITTALLVLNLVVAITYWARRPKRLLPEMPYTIASILAMVQASGLLAEVENKGQWRHNWRFGYGKFVGTDGKPHVGIERRPFVVPLDI